MYAYREITTISLKELSSVFNSAFSDYPINIALSEDELIHNIKLINIKLNLSFGAFYKDRLIGFILNSYGEYNGDKSVFDFATAILPEHRKNGAFSGLLSYAEDTLVKSGITHYYLEVLQQNESAIAIYKKKGFSITRGFSVLKYDASKTEEIVDNNVYEMEYIDFDLKKSNLILPVPFSFENCASIINANSDNYRVLVYGKSTVEAYIVYALGSIAQLAYNNIATLEKVIRVLLSRSGNVSAKNIDTEYPELISMLKGLGFYELTRQYEMVKQLGLEPAYQQPVG